MKKIFVLGMAVLMVVGFAGVSMAVLSGTKHDIAGKMCAVCHTPHKAISTMGPLWNQTVTTQTFTMYLSNTINSDIETSLPDGVSKLCLSCHDGVTTIDASGSTMGANKPGTDLSDDHPISFTYDSALAGLDTELVTPVGGTVGATPLPLFGTGSDQFECATCHNVHSNSIDKFLRMANSGSALCLNCHTK